MKETSSQECDNFKAHVRMECEIVSNYGKLLLIANDVSEAKSETCSIEFFWSIDSENVPL